MNDSIVVLIFMNLKGGRGRDTQGECAFQHNILPD